MAKWWYKYFAIIDKIFYILAYLSHSLTFFIELNGRIL